MKICTNSLTVFNIIEVKELKNIKRWDFKLFRNTACSLNTMHVLYIVDARLMRIKQSDVKYTSAYTNYFQKDVSESTSFCNDEALNPQSISIPKKLLIK